MNGDIVFFQFSRGAIMNRDFSGFLKRYNINVLPGGKPLAAMMNSLVTFVAGYDDDPRELYAIPEVRTFYRHLFEAWPYWLYFGNLDTEALMMAVLCTLQSLEAKTLLGQCRSQVRCYPLELLGVVSANLEPMNEMCLRAGFSGRDIAIRTNRILGYFGLPQ